MDVSKILIDVFFLLVMVGVVTMIVSNPNGAATLAGAGTGVVVGLTKSLEGKPA